MARVIGSALVLSTAGMASTVLAPASFALFIIALVWPLQRRLETPPAHAARVGRQRLLVSWSRSLGLGSLMCL